MMHISIPKPCHEDWNAMTPNQQGRHCTACAKTVVDFTGMSDEEVKYFFINKKKEESVCGRFKNEQLRRITIELPYNIYTITMPLWKQFLTACLLAFSSMLFSCDAGINNGATLGVMVPSVTTGDTVRPIPPPPPMLGGVMLQFDTIKKPTCSTIKGDTVYMEGFTAGDISIVPAENIMPVEVMGEPAIVQPDTLETMLTGKVAVGTSMPVSSQAIDTVTIKKDQPDCDNDFIKL
jgi:hypothetical protein